MSDATFGADKLTSIGSGNDSSDRSGYFVYGAWRGLMGSPLNGHLCVSFVSSKLLLTYDGVVTTRFAVS